MYVCVCVCVCVCVYTHTYIWLPSWLRQQRIYLQCRRLGFHPWVGKIPWRKAWKFTPVFLPEEFHGQRSLVELKELDMT